MKIILSLLLPLIFLAGSFLVYSLNESSFIQTKVFYSKPRPSSWNFQAIDTMKYSRDRAREKINDASFDETIEQQIENIASTGATHVAIATPYDEEFYPFLEKWVDSARKYKLKVWFRGNWSGWEGWFEYPKISKEEHLNKTREFIIEHADIFEDGDAFSSCPECENGGSGDPRKTGDITGYRKFLIDEYNLMNESFDEIDKEVQANLFSMNGDVARLTMDERTTTTLGGIVTIDHYVEKPADLASDILEYAQISKGRVVLGEFGAPIEEIHGMMSEQEQADWVENALQRIVEDKNVEGVSYWLNVGGETALWSKEGEPKLAVSVLKKFFSSPIIFGRVVDEFGVPIKEVEVNSLNEKVATDGDGYFEIRSEGGSAKSIFLSSKGYKEKHINIKNINIQQNIILIKENKSKFERFKLLLSPVVLE